MTLKIRIQVPKNGGGYEAKVERIEVEGGRFVAAHVTTLQGSEGGRKLEIVVPTSAVMPIVSKVAMKMPANRQPMGLSRPRKATMMAVKP